MLPDVKLAFEIVDGYFASDEPSAITDAWEILKTAVLAQQTTNTGMAAEAAQIAAELDEAIGHICGGTHDQAIGHINEALRQLRHA